MLSCGVAAGQADNGRYRYVPRTGGPRQLRPDDDGIWGSFPGRCWPPPGDDAEHAARSPAARRAPGSGCPARQHGLLAPEQQRADSALLPAIRDDEADVARPTLIGGHAVTDDRAVAVGDDQDVRGAGCPGKRAQQPGARRRDVGEEAEILAARRQAADELADPVGIGVARCAAAGLLTSPEFDS